MTQFHEGQDVEVYRAIGTGPNVRVWEKATVDRLNCTEISTGLTRKEKWWVQFPDGTRAVFDARNIRDHFPLDNHQMRFGSSPIG